ncbi:hypothetical protein JTE90_025266 [Oedothorax gibbosus]|uniref:Uncharacterized protein n=1 Tax=Oedothorax gibbosus TaxID=931172 RepID=A0AAV6U7A3_9ARAC|nr:hypothetical protein JTE90_025266 [Oedothorax gibbosus]
MLTPKEQAGLRDILDDLSDIDLFSIAKTVTKNLLSTKSRYDAVEAILKCLEKPSDLLKRQRVTKRVLFSYLLKVKSLVSPECSKTELVMMCLEEWKSTGNDTTTNYDRCCHPDVPNHTNNWLDVMGCQFSEWFFSHYNSLKDFGPEHFWVDCRMRGELNIASNQQQAEVIGANKVVSFLSSLIVNDRFFFHANNSQDSIICEQDPHGLVKIIISGVVHQDSNCIGLFDSAFGLVRNPNYDNNWKIKWIQLKINVTGGRREHVMPVNEGLKSICQRA